MVSGGFAEVSNNKITFLVESAEFGRILMWTAPCAPRNGLRSG